MTWRCDTCGETIDSAEHGWVEWKAVDTGGQFRKVGFRLVHSFPNGRGDGGCMYNDRHFASNESLSDLPLDSFLGPDGLMQLLEYTSDNPASADELLEMIKRLHIPGYEQARRHFEAAIRNGVFERNTKPGFHYQSDIEATNRWAEEQES